jgi:hypothetical protein
MVDLPGALLRKRTPRPRSVATSIGMGSGVSQPIAEVEAGLARLTVGPKMGGVNSSSRDATDG